MFGHFNHGMDAAAPAGKPYGVGDYFYAQDMAKDFLYLLGQAGKIKDLFSSYPVLVSGGVVTLGASAWQVNVTSLVALLDYAVQVSDGDAVWALPPATKTDVITAILNANPQSNLDVHSGGLLTPTADGVTMNYLWVQYDEVAPANATRSRAKGAGSYSYELRPAPVFGCGPVAPSGNDKVLLATMTVTAAGVITLSSQQPPTSGSFGYDVVIDSNAKLDAWCQCIDGSMKRVLVKRGTWTSSIGAPTSGRYIDVAKTGTKEIVGERGSKLVFNATSSGTKYCIIGPTLTDTTDVDMKIEGITIDFSSSGTGTIYGISTMLNINGCRINIKNCNGTVYGMSASNVRGTHIQIEGVVSGSLICFNSGVYTDCSIDGSATGIFGSFTGFSSCRCYNCVIDSINGTWNGRIGYNSCSAESCDVLFGGGGESGNVYGFANSAAYGIGLLRCTSEIGTGTSGEVAAFFNCNNVMMCTGQGTNSGTGAGYGFRNCQKCGFNHHKTVASKTANYSLSYADNGSNLCANTAAGGYNS